MHLLRIIFWLASVLLAGLSVFAIISNKGRNISLPEGLALSFGLGSGLISIQMGIMSLFGLTFSVLNIIIWWVPIVIFGLSILLKRGVLEKKDVRTGSSDAEGLTIFERFLFLGIGLEVIYAFFRAMIKPIESYDSVATFALKAKVFFINRTVGLDSFKDIFSRFPHIDYPLSLPLSESYFYVCMGGLNDLWVKLIFPLYFLSLIAGFYLVLRRTFSRKTGLIFTFCLASIPQINNYATIGYADLPFAFFYTMAFLYLFQWFRERITADLILSSLFCVCGVWMKNEGLLLLLGVSAVSLIYLFGENKGLKKGPFRLTVFYIASAMTLCIMYIAMRNHYGLSAGLFNLSALRPSVFFLNIKRIIPILYEYQIQFFGPKKWNLVWIFLIIGVYFNLKRLFRLPLRYATLSILFALSGYTALYVITPQEGGISWILSTTASRIFIHFTPLAVYWLALKYNDLGETI